MNMKYLAVWCWITNIASLVFRELFIGSDNSASDYPREVVKQALADNAAAVILAHNHLLLLNSLIFQVLIIYSYFYTLKCTLKLISNPSYSVIKYGPRILWKDQNLQSKLNKTHW